MPDSFQVIGWNMHHHIVELTKAGEFDGHHAARTVLIWYGMNIARSDSEKRGLQRGFVMQGCISQAATARATGLSKAAVSNAVRWLTEQGFIRTAYRYEGQRQYLSQVEIESYDADTEEDRKSRLTAPAKPAAKKRRNDRHLRLVAGVQ